MKIRLRHLLLLVLACAGVFALAGCQSNPQDSSVPWNRPADWEGKNPGMGGL